MFLLCLNIIFFSYLMKRLKQSTTTYIFRVCVRGSKMMVFQQNQKASGNNKYYFSSAYPKSFPPSPQFGKWTKKINICPALELGQKEIKLFLWRTITSSASSWMFTLSQPISSWITVVIFHVPRIEGCSSGRGDLYLFFPLQIIKKYWARC